MGELDVHRDDTITGPITAPPGTPEYQEQFEKQALGAADSVLRLWFVRVACGLFAIPAFYESVETFGESKNLFEAVFFSTFLILMGLECASIALFRKSFWLRYGLSGAKRR